MSEEPISASGTSIMILMSIATVVLTAAIAAFCVIGAWWLLPVIIMSLVGTTAGVVGYLFHVMGDDDAELPAH